MKRNVSRKTIAAFETIGLEIFDTLPTGMRGYLLADCIKRILCQGTPATSTSPAIRPIVEVITFGFGNYDETVFEFLSKCIKNRDDLDYLVYTMADMDYKQLMGCMNGAATRECLEEGCMKTICEAVRSTGLHDLLYADIRASEIGHTAAFE